MDKAAWQNESWWVSSFNYAPEVREGLDLPERLRFHDVTLRDGEQTPGVVFRAEEKVRIAKLLDEVGVDRIEVAMPAVSDEDVRAVKGVVEMGPEADVFVFSRAIESDINLALECGVDGIVLEFPTGEPRLIYQFSKWNEDDIIQIADRSAKYAKDKGLQVLLFPMDCTRARPEFLFRLLEEVGVLPEVDTIGLVDTTGSLTTEATTFLIHKMKEITGKPLEIHTHSDFGMSVAISLAAVAAGADTIHASVCGLGERAGNAPLEEAAIAARALYGLDSGIHLDKLGSLADVVREISGFPVAPGKPVVGRRAFTRESGMGVNFVIEQPLVLFALHPHTVGRKGEYVLGKKSGMASVSMKIDDLGLPPVTSAQQEAILSAVKQLGISKKALVTDEEFRGIVEDVKG
ncbi:MAG: LeuA family protein [Planctomycetota bacterium]|jgi:methanogen homocitrate synthase